MSYPVCTCRCMPCVCASKRNVGDEQREEIIRLLRLLVADQTAPPPEVKINVGAPPVERIVTNFSPREGADWCRWPDWSAKPDDSYCGAFANGKGGGVVHWDTDEVSGLRLWFHALLFSDGSIWDATNGWRK